MEQPENQINETQISSTIEQPQETGQSVSPALSGNIQSASLNFNNSTILKPKLSIPLVISLLMIAILATATLGYGMYNARKVHSYANNVQKILNNVPPVPSVGKFTADQEAKMWKKNYKYSSTLKNQINQLPAPKQGEDLVKYLVNFSDMTKDSYISSETWAICSSLEKNIESPLIQNKKTTYGVSDENAWIVELNSLTERTNNISAMISTGNDPYDSVGGYSIKDNKQDIDKLGSTMEEYKTFLESLKGKNINASDLKKNESLSNLKDLDASLTSSMPLVDGEAIANYIGAQNEVAKLKAITFVW